MKALGVLALTVPLVLALAGCHTGLQAYIGNDAGIDAGNDAGNDASHDAGTDGAISFCTVTAPGISTDPASPTLVNSQSRSFAVATNGSAAELFVGSPVGSQAPSGGTAIFSDIDLGPDGPIEIYAVCQVDGVVGGLQSTTHYMDKDTVGPNVQIVSPADNTWFVPANCPVAVTVTGIETGQMVCANLVGQMPLVPDGCAVSSGVSEEIELLVDCGTAEILFIDVTSMDAHGNPGADTVTLTVQHGSPTVLIESPADGQVYTKIHDTIDPATDCLEMNIVACTDNFFSPSSITLTIDGVLSPMVASVAAAACLGRSHTITWPAPVCFSQSPSGLQTPHTVEVAIGSDIAVSSFIIDTLAPVLELSCVQCEPSQSTYGIADDVCPATTDFDVLARIRVFGLETGEPVLLSVTNAGVPVGPSPYQELFTFPGPLDFNTPCGVVLAPGLNELTVNATDQAGNPAVPATLSVTYTP